MRPSPAGSVTFAVSTARWPRRAASTTAARRDRHERNVADDDQRDAVRRQHRQRRAYRVAGAARRVLHDEREVGRGERLAHGSPPCPNTRQIARGDSVRAASITCETTGRAGERMQDLRQRGVHALAESGGEDDDVERRGHEPDCERRRFG